MKIVLIVVGIAVLLFLVAMLFRTSRWKTILSAPPGEKSDELQDKHAYLHNKGVRCRVRAEENQPASGIAGGASYGATGSRSSASLRLQVHQDDIRKASDALEEFDRQRYTSQTPIV
ncbi:hypothetical protein [Paenibacillus spongiae]|uniref:DUF2007 domain-containing protein n=1 Tax=Paenibacillus spongiae TaxID=2909671 RepID=A0ABY5SH69_9BACL|nr:hypothetical protein [Paenibacillus spongiae]UVI31815.1 hypothetical protein L1F29_08375 [Paenibacillus spongiae]